MTHYIVVTVTDTLGKYAAYAIKCADQTNIAKTLSRINGLQSAYICRTYKAAAGLVATYNSGYASCGKYMYADFAF